MQQLADLRQIRHDPRTIILLLTVPSILVIVLKYVYQSRPSTFNIAPMMLGIFPLVAMFLVTSIATLRERTSGTLDRLMTMPISKADFIFGYAIAFTFVALVQASITSVVMLGLLGVTVQGGTVVVLVSAILSAFLGTALGLFMSAFATSEFQVVQFMPAMIMPQLLTCGLFMAREHMAKLLQWFADAMPLTYSVDSMKQVTMHSGWGHDLVKDFVIVAAFGIAALILGSITIRRQE